jgi:hypothetical protein
MRTPVFQPHITREARVSTSIARSSAGGSLSPQGCDFFRCAADVARCLSSPNPVQCLLSVAPHCLDCIPH